FDKFRKITNFANEDKKKYQLLDNALEEVYLKLTNEERNEKDDNDNVIKNPLKVKTKEAKNQAFSNCVEKFHM
ncbi:54_t:CDS:2, partial [Entrophospora sp. SA101]